MVVKFSRLLCCFLYLQLKKCSKKVPYKTVPLFLYVCLHFNDRRIITNSTTLTSSGENPINSKKIDEPKCAFGASEIRCCFSPFGFRYSIDLRSRNAFTDAILVSDTSGHLRPTFATKKEVALGFVGTEIYESRQGEL